MARRVRENQLIQDVSIRALANLAETRDWEPGNHIRRRQAYGSLLAGNLRSHPHYSHHMTERRIEMIVKAAPLHDIGKVGIPDQILLKNARLTDDVFAVIKTHSKLGSDAKGEAMRGALNNEEYDRSQTYCQ